MNKIRLGITFACIFALTGLCGLSNAQRRTQAPRGSKKCAANLEACIRQTGSDGCGRGDFDKNLNQQKNRTGSPTIFTKVRYSDMIRMTEPATWSPKKNRRSIDIPKQRIRGKTLKEGSPVRVIGFLRVARREGAESCNCELDADGQPGEYLTDIHLALTDGPKTSEDRSFTAEITPRIRALQDNPGHVIWSSIKQYEGKWIRVTGYLMLDAQHLHRSPPKRV